MTKRHIALHSALIDLECELKKLTLWDPQRPSDEALSSTQPFCIDTLNFPQWLQFIFLEKMSALVEHKAPLPPTCGIAPMAEEYFKATQYAASNLIEVLASIDAIIES